MQFLSTKKNVDLQLFSAVIKTTFVYSFNQGWNTTQLHRDNKKSPSFWTPSTNRVLWLWKKSCNQHHWGYFPPPKKKLTWQWNIHHLKMYFLLNIGIFQCHVSFHGRKPSYHPLRYGLWWKKCQLWICFNPRWNPDYHFGSIHLHDFRFSRLRLGVSGWCKIIDPRCSNVSGIFTYVYHQFVQVNMPFKYTI